jgi:glycine cleavage system H lipoate-binding protein/ActR/RegA family two-component response regulator
MVVLIVLVTFVVFVLVDLFLRLTLKRLEEKKVRLAREKALEVGLRLEFTDEAKSLKRVEVTNPKARILAVDDEAVILDSFRKILVVAGYSVDTVLTGPEALGLVRKNHYDFVFTDFKMPDMDGVESAVETMKHGAMDYVQKPFAEDELVALVDKLVIRRQARLEKETEPSIRLVTPSVGESPSRHEVNVPAGVFVSGSHAWVSVHMNGLVRLGIDDFTQKTIGQIDSLELPASGATIRKGETLFTLRYGDHRLTVPSPVSGRVTGVNAELRERPELIKLKPYQLGWVCTMDPASLTDDLRDLKIGAAAVTWYREEINRYGEMIRAALRAREGEGKSVRNGKDEGLDDVTWEVFEKALVRP